MNAAGLSVRGGALATPSECSCQVHTDE